MKKLLLALFLPIAFLAAQAQPKHLVITQVFGAGGLTNSPLSHDFVELYNPTAQAVSLDGWSIQYSPATTDRWATGTVKLAGTMAPGTYFLIQLKGIEGVGKALPTPDLIATVNVDLSATNGKIALVNSVAALETNCPAGNTIVDFVGFGSADCFERVAAQATSNTKSIMRLNNGCADTDDNKADFVTTAPSPRNSGAAANLCNGNSVSISGIMPAPFCISNVSGATGSVTFNAAGNFSNATINAVISDAAGTFTAPAIIGSTVINGSNPTGIIAVQIPKGLPTGRGYRVRIEAVNPALTGLPAAVEIINGAANLPTFSTSPNADNITLNWTAPTGCLDEVLIVAREGASITALPTSDGAAYVANLSFTGNSTVLDGGKVVYKGSTSGQTITGLEVGKEYYFKAFTRNGTYWSSGVELKVKTRLLPLPGEILINQVSPQYDSASYEYIELVNTTGKTFDLSELSISYHAKSGNKAVAGNTLAGTLQPHSYWLLSSKEMVIVGKTTLPRDGHCTDGFAATAGQIALLRKTDSMVIDGFGYGSIDSLTYTEVTPAPAPIAKGGFKRKAEGVDNNNNNADFERVANADIDLRNSHSRLANRGAAISAGNYARLYITGNAILTGSAVFSEKVVLQQGLLQLSNNNLTATSTEGGNSKSYIQTNGSGTLTLKNVGAAKTILPIGNATYNPVTISNGSGVDWQAHVTDEVLQQPAPFNQQKAVLRTWQVTPSATPATGAAIQLQYDDANAGQVGTQFTKEEVQVWNYSSAWSVAGNLQKPTETNGGKLATVNSWQQNGIFVIANAAAEAAALSVLPVLFTNVKATELPNAIQVDFTNSTESDVAYYLVERSANAVDFITIATLQPLHNNGGAATYQWLDKSRPAGNCFYRIKGVETNGKFIYSAVLKVTVDRSAKALTVFPNPLKGRQLTWEVSLPKGDYVLSVTGSNGQQVIKRSIDCSGGNISQVLELPAGIRPGVYLLQIINGKFTKQQLFVVL